MAKPENLNTLLFVDSGNPEDTQKALDLLGFLDGQTTNPSLVASNPDVKKQIAEGKKFKKEEIYEMYKGIIQKISGMIPNGSVSIEVYADLHTTADEMYDEAKKMYEWISNGHIKFPTNREGLICAERCVKEGMRVNMTLCFTQEQAGAVYSATQNATAGMLNGILAPVFVSPFIGRLDDRGENGMDLIKNIVDMYKNGDTHVQVLGASVRTLEHFMACIAYECDVITAPLNVLEEWVAQGMKLPDANYMYNSQGRTRIDYQVLDLNSEWTTFNLHDPLVEKGIQRFADDWNALIVPTT